jgi:hypothetical protein
VRQETKEKVEGQEVCSHQPEDKSMKTFKRLLLLVPFLLLLVPCNAFASLEPCASCTPWWHITPSVRPADLQPGSEGQLVETVSNLGDGIAAGETSPIVISDRLPNNVRAVGVEAVVLNGAPISAFPCKLKPVGEPLAPRCVFEGRLAPYDQLEVRIQVEALAGFSPGEVDTVSVSGGGAEPVTREHVLGGAAGFGVEEDELDAEQEGGAADTQAGSHPFQMTSTLVLNQYAGSSVFIPGTDKISRYPGYQTLPVAPVKDLSFKLPAGLIGNPTAFPQCTMTQFTEPVEEAGVAVNACPSDTAIGVATVFVDEPAGLGPLRQIVPLFNVQPAKGEPARFGFLVPACRVPVFLDTAVRSGSDYGVTVTTSNISQCAAFVSGQVTIWGVPGSPTHDNSRGWACLNEVRGDAHDNPCEPASEFRPPPLLVMPAFCSVNPATHLPEPLQTSVEADSWLEPKPAGQRQVFGGEPLPAVTGCNRLPFEPSITATPDISTTSSSSGLNVDVHVPQAESLNAEGLSIGEPRKITVALPPGVAINPSGGDELEGCTSNSGALSAGQLGNPGDQVGYLGKEELKDIPGTETLLFSPRLPGSTTALLADETGILEPGVNFCANGSKIGEATIRTPLLPNPVKGFVYLASQNQNPFGSLITMYLVAEDPVSGVLVKLAGQVGLCQSPGQIIFGLSCQGAGQIITEFDNSPQAPFEDAELHFFGGERAPLATPAHCGAYTTTASFVPWSAEPSDESELTRTASSTFEIEHGPKTASEPGGGPCPGASLPFSPALTGGALNLNAGAFSPFTATMTRQNGEQNLQSLEVHLPPGLSGILTGVELCPEPQANLGECPSNSLIGETTLSVGVGGDPFPVRGGRFYLTGPYNGTGSCTTGSSGCAPFGITFEVPAKAGPFDLKRNSANPASEDACDCVVVRGKIEINPLTTAITITSNPPGTPYAIPTSLEGIPLEIQHVNATTTRGNFQFNPTNCNKMEVTGTIHSSEGATDTIGVPFQVTNCKDLSFEPKLTGSTSGKTSRANGASLSVKLVYPAGLRGTQANIRQVKVELPKVLPSRLTTLQKACTSAQFQADPAGCPAASIVGHAKAITPVIPVPLEGPAYFVSNGGESFPNLVMVLQGYGVTIDLVGDTFINEKTGITSSTFKTIPDQPVGSFELTLPQGKYSALAAAGNLCKDKINVPTEFIAQNGAELHETTKITVTGCPKHKAKHAKKSSKHKRKTRSRPKKKKKH